MANYALEEKIKTLSSEYIQQEATSSLLLLLHSILEQKNPDTPTSPYEKPTDILEIQSTIQNYLLQLETLLEEDAAEQRLKALDDCMAMKKNIVDIYETIYYYISTWNLHSSLLSDEVAIRKYKEERAFEQTIEWNVFYLDCQAFLENSETVLEQKERIGKLLQCIPIKMARTKYYDMLQQSLSYAFSGESESLIQSSLSVLKGFFAPEQAKNYGKYYTDIAQWLSGRKEISYAQLSDEALQEEYTDFQSVFETLQTIEEEFKCLFNDINTLILLFYLGYSLEELTMQSVAYADFYHTLCEMITGELEETEQAAYYEQLSIDLEEAIESAIDKANATGKEEFTMMQKVKDFSTLQEDTQKMLFTEDFVRDCYYSDLNDALFQFQTKQDLPPASEKWKQKTFQTFIETIQNAFSTLPVPIRKMTMQTILGALPPVFTVEQTLSMIQDAIETASSFEHKILIVDKIGMLFENAGFQYMTENIEEEHCGCGHDHHDCGQGHHHHHGHEHHHAHCDCGHHHHE